MTVNYKITKILKTKIPGSSKKGRRKWEQRGQKEKEDEEIEERREKDSTGEFIKKMLLPIF